MELLRPNARLQRASSTKDRAEGGDRKSGGQSSEDPSEMRHRSWNVGTKATLAIFSAIGRSDCLMGGFRF